MRGCEDAGRGGGQAEDDVNEILIFMEVATRFSLRSCTETEEMHITPLQGKCFSSTIFPSFPQKVYRKNVKKNKKKI